MEKFQTFLGIPGVENTLPEIITTVEKKKVNEGAIRAFFSQVAVCSTQKHGKDLKDLQAVLRQVPTVNLNEIAGALAAGTGEILTFKVYEQIVSQFGSQGNLLNRNF